MPSSKRSRAFFWLQPQVSFGKIKVDFAPEVLYTTTMKQTIIVLAISMLVSACGGVTAKQVLDTARAAKAASVITESGVAAEVNNCVKDWFDPRNRGSGCHK